MSTLTEERPVAPAPAATDSLDAIVQSLREVRLAWREANGRAREPAGRELPSEDTLAHVLEDLGGVLFPMRLGPPELRRRKRIGM
jgi:serine O-acetyltransferase